MFGRLTFSVAGTR